MRERIRRAFHYAAAAMGERGYSQTWDECIADLSDEMYVNTSGSTLTLAFRASDSEEDDWFGRRGNTNIRLRDHQHLGMSRVIDSMSNHIQRWVSTRPVCVFTGHSRGGGLATLAAARFGRRGDWCITFGAPCVGDEVFRERYASRSLHSLRVVCGADFFTRVGRFVGGVHVCAPLRVKPMPWVWLMPFRTLIQHHPAQYAYGIERLPE